MHQELNTLGRELNRFLTAKLPSIQDDWWNVLVVNEFTFQQQRLVAQRGMTSLNELDLAGLLRIVDRNWYELSRIHSFPPETRNWLKETQSIRNRWAHLPPSGLPSEDQY
ncbi:MAG: Swt1 family HEPN domain-containing protein [Oceanococcaceae bacterium]